MSQSRFTLSENPQNSGCRSEGGAGIFIIHHLHPVAIIECDLVRELSASELSKTFAYVNSNGGHEHWLLTIRFCFQDIAKQEVDVQKLLTRAWHWYAAYLKWEDTNIDMEDYGQEN